MRAAPAKYFVDWNLVDRIPVSAVAALDPDTGLFLQEVPAGLVFLTQADVAGCDLDLAGCRPDIEDFVVAGGQVLVDLRRDSEPCHGVA